MFNEMLVIKELGKTQQSILPRLAAEAINVYTCKKYFDDFGRYIPLKDETLRANICEIPVNFDVITIQPHSLKIYNCEEYSDDIFEAAATLAENHNIPINNFDRIRRLRPIDNENFSGCAKIYSGIVTGSALAFDITVNPTDISFTGLSKMLLLPGMVYHDTQGIFNPNVTRVVHYCDKTRLEPFCARLDPCDLSVCLKQGLSRGSAGAEKSCKVPVRFVPNSVASGVFDPAKHAYVAKCIDTNAVKSYSPQVILHNAQCFVTIDAEVIVGKAFVEKKIPYNPTATTTLAFVLIEPTLIIVFICEMTESERLEFAKNHNEWYRAVPMSKFSHVMLERVTEVYLMCSLNKLKTVLNKNGTVLRTDIPCLDDIVGMSIPIYYSKDMRS